jgi:hypothetical protein
MQNRTLLHLYKLIKFSEAASNSWVTNSAVLQANQTDPQPKFARHSAAGSGYGQANQAIHVKKVQGGPITSGIYAGERTARGTGLTLTVKSWTEVADDAAAMLGANGERGSRQRRRIERRVGEECVAAGR